MDAAGYTYVLLDSGDRQLWAAGPQTTLKVGDDLTLKNEMTMRNFRSETLGRTFDVVYFVPRFELSDGPALTPVGVGSATPRHGSASAKPTSKDAIDLSNIPKISGGNTVSELFAGRDELAGKEVLLRGRVVKFNASIMGRNWLHVRDGSGSEGSDELTVTTGDSAKPGDLVVIRGTLRTNQDFGHGYSYEVLVEDARITVE